ncbi:MAG: universal stress protein [Elusimicrobia bacterium]|nr:universal stress protein [Elusimicrobiota bacterium]
MPLIAAKPLRLKPQFDKPAAHFPPRKIMVPVDLSSVSLAGWRQAISLGARLNARVEGLYVQEWMYSLLGLGAGDLPMTAMESEKSFAQVRERLGPGAAVNLMIGSQAQDTIISWAERNRFDWIVMGTHGRTGFDRAVSGSVAEMVVRHSALPVLVVHQYVSRIRSVLAPVNFEAYSWDGLRMAAETAAALGARLTVLHVVNTPIYGRSTGLSSFKHMLTDFIEHLPGSLREACRIERELAFGEPAREIVSAAEGMDLIVLSAHRKGFLKDTVLGTTVERVLRHSHKPVLAVPTGVAAKRRAV